MCYLFKIITKYLNSIKNEIVIDSQHLLRYKEIMNYKIDPFCHRQFQQKSYNRIYYQSIQHFQNQINQIYLSKQYTLKPGYASFCKHLLVPNFTTTPRSVIEITQSNESLLKTTYEARNSKELPVLKRYFNGAEIKDRPIAKYLDVILYDCEQMEKQHLAMNNQSHTPDFKYQFAVVSIMPVDSNGQIPIEPITMMRNALGVQYGGSGHSINKQEYLKSVAFWEKHAHVK